MPLYFAYGSNLKAERLTSRVGEVAVHGIAKLANHRLSFAKRGKDGSGKACCVAERGDAVFGVLYSLTEAQFAQLDTFEWGYSRDAVQLEQGDGTEIHALTYRAEHLLDALTPFHWYKALLVDGAHEHGLPAAWITRLETIDAREDPHGA